MIEIPDADALAEFDREIEATPPRELPSRVRRRPGKWRCSRCRRTRYGTQHRIAKTWTQGDHEITRIVTVCEDCAHRRGPCESCAGLTHRVQGETCSECGLRFAAEPEREPETYGASPIAAFERV